MAILSVLTFKGATYHLKELRLDPHALLNANLIDFEEETGSKGTGYFTFMDDGFSHGLITLLIAKEYPKFILVTATTQHLARAIEWVVELNIHLHFLPPETDEIDSSDLDKDLKVKKLYFEVSA